MVGWTVFTMQLQWVAYQAVKTMSSALHLIFPCVCVALQSFTVLHRNSLIAGETLMHLKAGIWKILFRFGHH